MAPARDPLRPGHVARRARRHRDRARRHGPVGPADDRRSRDLRGARGSAPRAAVDPVRARARDRRHRAGQHRAQEVQGRGRSSSPPRVGPRRRAFVAVFQGVSTLGDRGDGTRTGPARASAARARLGRDQGPADLPDLADRLAAVDPPRIQVPSRPRSPTASAASSALRADGERRPADPGAALCRRPAPRRAGSLLPFGATLAGACLVLFGRCSPAGRSCCGASIRRPAPAPPSRVERRRRGPADDAGLRGRRRDRARRRRGARPPGLALRGEQEDVRGDLAG